MQHFSKTQLAKDLPEQPGPNGTQTASSAEVPSDWAPPERTVLHIMRLHGKNRTEAIAWLRNHEQERRAAALSFANFLIDGREEDQQRLARLPRHLSPDNQRELPAALSLFASYQPEHPQAVEALAAAWDWAYRTLHGERVGLVLWSKENTVEVGGHTETRGYGSGKTHLSRAAEQMLRWGGVDRGNWVSTVDLFSRIQSTYNDNAPFTEYDVLLEYRRGWLILDDMGKEPVKAVSAGWYEARYFQLIDATHKGNSLFVTSNFDLDAIATRVGNAAFERLVQMCGRSGFVDLSDVPSYRPRLGREQDARRARALDDDDLRMPYKDSD